MTGFKGVHPLVSFIYFLAILGFSMATYNPIILGLSAFGGLLYYYSLKKSFKGILVLVPMFIFVAILNPMFSHKGATILFYFRNPITLESIIYGLCASFMLFSVMVWFGCFNHIMTSDKIVYIFGRILPKGSLIMSMTLRLVPRIKNHFNTVLECQKAIGYDIKRAKFRDKIIIGARVVSAVLSWIFEGSLVTSDAMQSRGYGKKGRSNYTVFEFRTRDKVLLIIIAVLAIIVISGIYMEFIRFEFYPVIYCESFVKGVLFYISFFVLASMPFVLDCCEVAKWNYLKSKI